MGTGTGTTGRGKTLRRTLFGKWAFLALMMAVSTGHEPAAASESENADLARGEALYKLCTQCHGSAGGGNSAALAPAIANLPQWYVEKQLTKFKQGIRGLHHKDTGGLRMYPMSQWLRDDADIRDVAAYVARLPETAPSHELGDVGDPTRGQGYYAVCSACHGPDARGNEPMGAPPLVGLNDWYIETSLRKYKAGIRGGDPRDALGSAMIGMAGTLPNDQAILDVIAHIQSLDSASDRSAEKE